MIGWLESPLRLLTASLLAGGLLSFAGVAIAIEIKVDPQGKYLDSQPTETMNFKADETIQRIKEVLETTDGGYPPELHDLYLGDKKLEDNKTLEGSGIKEGDTLILKEKETQ